MSIGRVYDHVVDWLKYYRAAMNEPRTLEGGAGSGQYSVFFPEEKYFSYDVEHTWYDLIRKPTVFASSDSLPFESGSFEFSFNVAAFDYFKNPQKSLSEIYRCLKPGGKLVVFTYDEPTLEKIHKNCQALGESAAHINHHVFNDCILKEMGEEVGFKIRKIPLRPNMGLWEKGILYFRPTFYRNYEFTK